ncbi:DUF2339 domain-containing protein [Arsukibacterium sp.]|uniref:DUF2339 domain-containing protein n=1 Tax=Arsukibacterium sp. TaxID=1977258 RepID=UPI002FD90622
MELLALLAVLTLLAGAICGIVAVVQQSGLQRDIQQLRQQLLRLQQQVSQPAHTSSSGAAAQAAPQEDLMAASPASVLPVVNAPVLAASIAIPETATITIPQAASAAASRPQSAAVPPVQTPTQWFSWLEQQLMQHGMVWLGAVALSLGGIFLVRHSLEAGWFSPELRIFSGVVMALLLLGASEWLHTKRLLSQNLKHYVPAALASAGFITLYASLLMAQQFYQLLSPGLTFVLLALVALAASWFSLRQGPILAVIGIVGAYAVPILVSSEQPQLGALLIYIAVISLSSVLVERRVQVPWLWYLPMAAHSLWLLLSFSLLNAENVWQWWLLLLASMALLVWLPRLGYRYSGIQLAAVPLAQWWPPLRQHGLGLVFLLLALACLWQFNLLSGFMAVVALIALLYLMALTDGRSELWLWCAGLVALCWVGLNPLQLGVEPLLSWSSGSLMQIQLLFVLLCLPVVVRLVLPGRWHWSAALAVLPIVLLGSSYHLATSEVQLQLQPGWMAYAASLVVLQAWLSTRREHQAAAFIHSAGANFALTYCFTLYLSAAGLTLAIAAQLVLLALLSRQRQVMLAPWVIKLLVTVLLVRLTSAPLLGSYEGISLLGMHWSLLVYPLVLAGMLLARQLWRDTELQPWLEGAILHVLALFITVQTQYWFNQQQLQFSQLDFGSMLLHSVNWLLLAWVYLWRAERAGKLATLYQLAALLLVIGAAYWHLQLNTTFNPYFSVQPLGSWPLFNALALLWALPALLILAISRLPPARPQQRWLHALALVYGLLYISSSIRHFWQDNTVLLFLPTSNAEFYSYSIVYLLLALVSILLAHWRGWPLVRKGGFLLLAVVVLKVFLVDLNELTGLLRAASFIGLGLCLLLLGAWFQYLQRQQQDKAVSQAG